MLFEISSLLCINKLSKQLCLATVRDLHIFKLGKVRILYFLKKGKMIFFTTCSLILNCTSAVGQEKAPPKTSGSASEKTSYHRLQARYGLVGELCGHFTPKRDLSGRALGHLFGWLPQSFLGQPAFFRRTAQVFWCSTRCSGRCSTRCPAGVLVFHHVFYQMFW